MKKLVLLLLLIFVGFAGWRAGGILSPDALGMAVGILLGVFASLPVALLLLAATRRAPQREFAPSTPNQSGQHSGQMPIVVVAPPAQPGYGQMTGQHFSQLSSPQSQGWPTPYQMPHQAPRPERSFTIVGEQADWVEDD